MSVRKYKQLQSDTVLFISDNVNSKVATFAITAPRLTFICIAHNHSVPALEETQGVSIAKKGTGKFYLRKGSQLVVRPKRNTQTHKNTAVF
jgi:hypothetical protein